MSINKKQILSHLKADYTMSVSYHDEWRVKRDKWIREYNGDLYGNEEKGKSQVVSRDIKKVSAWQHAAIIDPFVSAPDMVETHPITFEDKAASDQANIVLNYQFCRDFPRYNFISEAYKVQQREGTVVVKVAWETEEGEVEVDVPVIEVQLIPNANGELVPQEVQTGVRTETQTKLIINRPTAEVCDNIMLYIDPTCIGDISNAQFVIQRFMSNKSKLKAAGIYKNIDKIPAASQTPYDGVYDQYDKRDVNRFTFSDDARKELEVLEYWGNYDLHDNGEAIPIICVWVGDVIIRLEENPYPKGEIPFVSCSYDAEPFSINGNANADLLSADQKIKTGVKRAFINTLDSGTQGQKGFPKGMLDPINKKKFMEGKDFEFNIGTAQDIWTGKFADIPVSTMQFYQGVSQEIESLTGVRAYGGQGGGAALGSATAERGALDATAKREVDISRNLKENLIVPLLRKWHAMNALFLEDEQVMRLTNGELVPIKRDDLDGNIDIDISVSTPATDAEKSGELSFMLQTMGQTLPFEMTQLILAEIAKLKRMPTLAQQIATYQVQPDPMAQQMQQLEMQKLQAEIAERNSRATENSSDIRLKEAKATNEEAKATNEEAKARQTHSNADTTDLDFLRKQSGQDKLDDMAIQDNKDMNQGLLNKQKDNS